MRGGVELYYFTHPDPLGCFISYQNGNIYLFDNKPRLSLYLFDKSLSLQILEENAQYGQ